MRSFGKAIMTGMLVSGIFAGLFAASGGGPATASTIVDGDDAEERVAYAPDETVWLRPKVRPGTKTWVLLQARGVFPGTVFARPSDERAASTGSYLEVYSSQGQPVGQAPELYYSPAVPSERLDFILGPPGYLSSELVVTTSAGEMGAQETVQTLILLEPYSEAYFGVLKEKTKDLFDEAKDFEDIDFPF